jgi:CRISPR-associated protein Cmr4
MTLPISKLITLQAITFLHPGTGQTTGVVDLPVQREVHTGFPMFAASGFKGSLRDKAERLWGQKNDRIITVFGSQSGEDNPSAGALALTDTRILAFPVRSLQKVFVWVTCPMVLQRLKRDGGLIGLTCPDFRDQQKETAFVEDDMAITSPLILEEISFKVEKKDTVSGVSSFINGKLHPDGGFDPKRLVLIPDSDFEYLVNHATQISIRIKLNEKKTTAGGGGNMWVEETLPPETIMYALAVCHAPRMNGQKGGPEIVVQVLDALMDDSHIQIGGNETVGQGWCCIKMTGGA